MLVSNFCLHSDVFTTDLPPRENVHQNLAFAEERRIDLRNVEWVPAGMNAHYKHAKAQTVFGIPPALHIDIQRRYVTNALNACCLKKALAWNRAGLGELNVHPHMLRHACGHKLANQGVDARTLQAYLGHANIQHTVRYTALSPERFRGDVDVDLVHDASVESGAVDRGATFFIALPKTAEERL